MFSSKTQMTYHSVKKQPRSKYFKFGVSILLLMLFVVFWPTLRSLLVPVFAPVASQVGLTNTLLGKVFRSFDTTFTSKASLARENQSLALLVERLENELALRDGNSREVDTAVASVSSSSEPILVMYPLMRDMTTVYSSVLLSKGFRDGVVEGSLVFVRGRHAVCFISDVYVSTSLCTLFTAHQENTEGVIGSSTVFLSGNGGSSYTASVSQGEGVNVGDIVYLKENPLYTLGEVVRVDKDMQAAFWKVYVKSGYNPITSHAFYMSQ